MRSEQEIFDELAALCVSPGYAHAIAYFCYRDHIVAFGDELKPKDFSQLFSIERLIRTEISTLIGLMIRGPRDLALPAPNKLEAYIDQTEALLKELHQAMLEPTTAQLQAALADPATAKNADPFWNAVALREPIFYGVESAYGFQYRDFAPKKIRARRRLVEEKQGVLARRRQAGRCDHQ